MERFFYLLLFYVKLDLNLNENDYSYDLTMSSQGVKRKRENGSAQTTLFNWGISQNQNESPAKKSKSISVNTPGKENRKFKPAWLTEFSFLRYDTSINTMFCELCEGAGRSTDTLYHPLLLLKLRPDDYKC